MDLPKIFKPDYEYKLIRLGKKNDGGYLIGIRTVKESAYLISFGIKDDWSFEKNFLRENQVNSMCFDSENILDILKKKVVSDIKSFFFNFNLVKLIKNVMIFVDYLNFQKKTKFIKKEISTGDLNEIISQTNSDKIFLKIDIESSEYSILSEIIQNQKRIVGLVIEFHDVTKNMNILIDFVRKFELKITHVHANNFSKLDKDENMKIIEMSFEKNPEIIGNEKIFPNNLDMKNWKRGPEIKLNFYE